MNEINGRMKTEKMGLLGGFSICPNHKRFFRFGWVCKGGQDTPFSDMKALFSNLLVIPFVLLLCSVMVSITGCSTLPFGKQPDMVTDTSYSNARVTILVEQLVPNSTKRIRRAAPFDNVNPDGLVSQLARYLTEKTGEVAVSNKSFQVVSRGKTLDSLTKNGIPNDGKLDRESAKKLGESLGVDTVILGLITDLQKGSNVDVTLKAIDTQGGNVISAASVDMIRSKQIQSLLSSF